MGKATDDDLAELHSAVARSLTDAVRGAEILHDDGRIEKQPASAAHLAAAITFLKNNNITSDPATNQDLADLNRALTEKRRKSKLGLLEIQDAVDKLGLEMGGVMYEGP